MEQEEIYKLAFLTEEIERARDSAERRRANYKEKAIAAYMFTTVFATIATVLLGLKFDNLVFMGHELLNWQNWAQRIALVITALISIVSAYNSFYNHKELWVVNNETKNALTKLLSDINFLKAGRPGLLMPEIDAFRKRYQDIMDETNSSWKGFRSKSS